MFEPQTTNLSGYEHIELGAQIGLTRFSILLEFRYQF